MAYLFMGLLIVAALLTMGYIATPETKGRTRSALFLLFMASVACWFISGLVLVLTI